MEAGRKLYWHRCSDCSPLSNLRNLTERKSRNLDSCLADEQLVLYGNLSVLGLLIMKNKTIAPPDADSADFSIFKFMQVSENSRNLSTFIR